MLTIFVGLVAGAILAYVYRRDVDSAVHDGIKKCMDKYGDVNNTVCTNEINFMQEEVRLCLCCFIQIYALEGF